MEAQQQMEKKSLFKHQIAPKPQLASLAGNIKEFKKQIR